jgi:hypothetical protein
MHRQSEHRSVMYCDVPVLIKSLNDFATKANIHANRLQSVALQTKSSPLAPACTGSGGSPYRWLTLPFGERERGVSVRVAAISNY